MMSLLWIACTPSRYAHHTQLIIYPVRSNLFLLLTALGSGFIKIINKASFGSTEFHVIRTKDEQTLMPEYLWVLLRLNHIRQAAKRFFIGSAGQQRVPSNFLENLRIPLPPISIQKSIVQNVLYSRAEITRQRALAASIRREAEAEVEALILGTKQISELEKK